MPKKRVKVDDSHEVLFAEVQRMLIRTHGFSAEHASVLGEELKRVLACKAHVDDPMELGVPPRVDLAWQLAILNTKEYHRYCYQTFHTFIHHSTQTDDDDTNKMVKTKEVYLELFHCQPNSFAWTAHDYPDDGLFAVNIRVISGQSFTIHIRSHSTILEVKHKISQKYEWIHILQQRLLFGRRDLLDSRTCDSYDIQKESTIHCILRLIGC